MKRKYDGLKNEAASILSKESCSLSVHSTRKLLKAHKNLTICTFEIAPVFPAFSGVDSKSLAETICLEDRIDFMMGYEKDYTKSLELNERLYLPNYKKSVEHPKIKPRMRMMLIKWLKAVSAKFSLMRKTFESGISHVDRFLSLCPEFDPSRLQLLGASSLFLACKLEEQRPPICADFSKSTGDSFSIRQICEFELELVQKLGWELNPPTFVDWISLFAYKWLSQRVKLNLDINSQLDFFAIAGMDTLMEKLDMLMLDPLFMQFPSSLVSAALMHMMVFPEANFLLCTGYQPDELRICMESISHLSRPEDSQVLREPFQLQSIAMKFDDEF
eukprot:CAMPEP_0113939096 /NCGR_PEP_ID=MMETSP1339-20121228/5481_1 /TAXON_ID=94617 /ORGANISM="Fibrocapsa japonica" /LENGTH=330 /DNA_ID=CAMNT_0000942507 /DNA_START=66 /DNA_END=1058 /DNA_ORIENTATION=+ /assembly_acc=CAM_ASM_000762